MGIDYVLIAGVLMYASVVRLFDKYDIGAVPGAFAAVLGPLSLKLFLKMLVLTGYHMSLSSLVTATDLLTVAIQLLVACGIFYELRKSEESLESWFVWALGGGFILFFVVPYVVGLTVRI